MDIGPPALSPLFIIITKQKTLKCLVEKLSEIDFYPYVQQDILLGLKTDMYRKKAMVDLKQEDTLLKSCCMENDF